MRKKNPKVNNPVFRIKAFMFTKYFLLSLTVILLDWKRFLCDVVILFWQVTSISQHV